MRTIGLSLIAFFGYIGVAEAGGPARCAYRLQDDHGGRAIVRLAQTERTLVSLVVVGAAPDTLYTVWNDFRVRPATEPPEGHPLDAAAVAPTLPLAEPFTNGLSQPDRNGFVTGPDGSAVWGIVLDYPLDEAPVVASGLATAGDNRLGGAWLPVFDRATSLQMLGDRGQPMIERGVVQGLTIVRHAEGDVTHGATPGVSGRNHFPAFSANFPVRCRP